MRLLLVFLAVIVLAPVMHGAECGARHSGSAVVGRISDGVLHRHWAVVADCAHPERPWVMAEDASVAAPPKNARPLSGNVLVVRAGAKVFLWRKTKDARILLTATALGPGRTGDSICVRTEAGAVLVGRVQGPGEVELMDSTKWKAQ
jgi:hypothetical protein